jgi:uncharacterized membrane protein
MSSTEVRDHDEPRLGTIRAFQGLTIMLFALVMGVFWGTWFALARTMDRLRAQTFLDVGQHMIHNLAVPMAILMPAALLSAVTAVVLQWPARPSPALWWQLAGLLLMAAALAVTLLVEVPIDNQIKTWAVRTLPADWRSIQARWELFHTIRTMLSIAALAAATIAALVPNARRAAPAGIDQRELAGH